MDDVEPFEQFLARTAEEPPERYLPIMLASQGGSGLDRAAAVREFEKMRDYILGIYRDVKPVSSFLDAAGQPVDCLPFDRQPAVRSAHQAGIEVLRHLPPPPRLAGGRGPAAPGPVGADPTTDPTRPRPPCPPGTVPVRRVTLEWMAGSGTFENFFRKRPGPT